MSEALTTLRKTASGPPDKDESISFWWLMYVIM